MVQISQTDSEFEDTDVEGNSSSENTPIGLQSRRYLVEVSSWALSSHCSNSHVRFRLRLH